MQKTIKDLFIDELRDILSSEEQIVKALPKAAEAAESHDLKEALRSHLQETKNQIKRLEKVFKLLKLDKKEKFCKATKGLVDECSEAIQEYHKSAVRDSAIISKCQRIEHYEISAYGTVCTLAKELGHKEVAKILHETLDEEEHADKKLSKIAEGGFLTTGINHEANISEPVEHHHKVHHHTTSHGTHAHTSSSHHTKSHKAAPKKATAKKSVKKTAVKSASSAATKSHSVKKTTAKKHPTKKTAAKKSVIQKITAKLPTSAVKAVKSGVKKVKKAL